MEATAARRKCLCPERWMPNWRISVFPLAQMKCMCDEVVLLRMLLKPSFTKHVYGKRQIDDLLLLILASELGSG
eukprot:g19149.t1